MKPLVIYHGNCADGFTSAWLANMAFAGNVQTKEWRVDAVAGFYGEAPPDVTGRQVFILDFSYPVEDMNVISAQADHVIVIDHHESAIRKIGETRWHNVELNLSTERSGAYLTSLYFWPDREPEDMVKLVDDRDRWVFRDQRSRPFAAGLFSRLYTLEDWNNAANNVEQTCVEGEAIERKHHKDIEELLKVGVQMDNINQYSVPVCNLPYTMASDAGHKMLEMYPKAPFAATWFLRNDGKRVYSLRSRKGGMNVAKVAEIFGGGGHENAAGFTVL